MRSLCLLAALLVACELRAQTIQLPSFHSVGVNTTVVVPDSGGAYIAKERQITSGYSTFGGIPRNQGWGIRRSASSLGTTARIHDLQAADAALLGSRQGGASGEVVPTLRTSAGTAPADAPAASVSELIRRRAEQSAATQQEALALVAKARLAHAQGKHSVAKIHYRAAARTAQGELRQQIIDEFQALAPKSSAQPAAH
jgi:hypothetical protein